MGLGPGDSHTYYSQHPHAAINAFMDYVLLLDATVLVRSGSSFSGTVAKMKDMICQTALNVTLGHSRLYVCTPRGASC